MTYYDTEIEYLESTSTQWIDTEIIPDATTGFEIKVVCSNNYDTYFIGLRNNSNNTRWSAGHSNLGFYWGYGNYQSSGRLSGTSATVKLNYLNDKKYVATNGSNTVDVLLPTLSFTPAYNIRLFGSAGVNANYSKWSGKIYYCQITQGSELIMDLIPVRIGSVGYMYDKVSDRLFGNAGTGSFTLGPDVKVTSPIVGKPKVSSIRRLMIQLMPKYIPNYLCFTALESGTFTFTMDTGLSPSNYEYISYSNDGGNSWVTTYNVASEQVTTTVNVTEGDSVLWRGYSPNGNRIGCSNVKSNCGYFGGTAKFNVSGCIVSLIKNKSFKGFEDMCIAVSSLFNGSKVVEVDEDLLPCKRLTLSYEYSSLFNGCTYLTKPPKLPATELGARNSYENMFLNCKAFSVAPELPTETLTITCYYNMFYGTRVTYVKMLAKTLGLQSLTNWMRGVPNVSTSIFVKHIDATWTTTGNNGVPTNWTIIYYDPTEDKYYTSQDKSQECDDHGNPI